MAKSKIAEQTVELNGADVEMVQEVSEVKQKAKYTKAQIINTSKFEHCRDIVDVIIGSDEEVTIKELEQRINEFLKKEVN